MQAVILAGGMGTRLRPLTYTLPKPMLPIGDKPVLGHTITALASAGCTEIIITTNYLADIIEEYLIRLRPPIPVHCVRESRPLGTAGCIKNLDKRLQEEFMVVQGDALANMDYAGFLSFHAQSNADVTISVNHVSDTREFGIVAFDDDGRITQFQEKPRPEEAFSNFANSGFYILKKELFNSVPFGTPFDFARELFPQLMAQERRFFAWKMQGFWVDIGRINNYLAGNMHAVSGMASIPPDVAIPESTTLLAPYLIGPGVKIGAGCTIGPGAIIGAGSSVGDGAHIANTVVYDDVHLGSRSRLTDCVIASGARIGSNVTVESLAVVGEGCDVGIGAHISAHSRIGPLIPVAAGVAIEGVVAPKLERLNGLQRSLAGSAVMAQLTPDEREVYALIAEFGEMTARDLAEANSSPLFKVMSLLHSLEKQEFVLSTQDVPKRYALTREEQHVARRILFVDQLFENREIFDMVFTLQGHSLRLACDGDEAVAAVNEERFDAIVMDTALPDQDGWNAVRHIRELENGRTTPIIMFNAADDQKAQQRRKELGAEGYFVKPIIPEELLPHVIRLIKRD